jgi:AbrB family looped-hinge helix DNA binding protein
MDTDKKYKGYSTYIDDGGTCRMRKEIAIISVTKNGRITIPEEIRRELEIADGSKIKLELSTEDNKKTIILSKI